MKKYSVSYSNEFNYLFKKLDKPIRREIIQWIENNLLGTDNPRRTGKPLKGELRNYWRYRIGNHRLLVKIYDEKLEVVNVAVGHRKNIYQLMTGKK